MKTIYAMASAMLFFAASTGCGDNGKKASSATDTTTTAGARSTATVHKKTLNGVDQQTAGQMIRNFEQQMTTLQQAPITFFINKDMVAKIVKVLDADAASTPAGSPKPDGVRVYFAKKSAAEPLTLLIIATREFKSAAQPDKTHDDYYEHSSAAADVLFNPQQTKLEIKATYNDPGATLFKRCTTCTDDTSCGEDAHYLRRKDAEDMVANYTAHPFNTRAEWFDTEMLRDMVKDQQCDGIRVYLARHLPNDQVARNRNRDTFILTTTKLVTPGNYYEDYFDCHTLKNFVKKYEDKIGHGMFPPPFDNGELCPTNCN
ncbi:hypothetical protein ACFQZX_18130 [Mucilaginibacter litoreus]|uniref:Lipoprotein n=1 Tax=Mucilaginibacter litoreus TaxID=1048221 RepID=A0ABW3AYC9_9SPHI